MSGEHDWIKWARIPTSYVLLDINGVLFESGEEHPIEGAVEGLKKIDEYFNFCLVTNECTLPKRQLAQKLNKFGFDMVTPEKIVSPAPTACQYIVENSLRPRLHVWDGVLEDFEPALEAVRQADAKSGTKKPPNCLVVGDVLGRLSRDFVDDSLDVMLNSGQKPEIITLGAGRYYKDSGKLRMDTGAYARAFGYALGVDKFTCLGKPSAEFFKLALSSIETVNDKPVTSSNTVMIGDDIVSDVGGAQAAGMRGYLVRTGKYKPSDETAHGIKADEVFENLQDAAHKITGAEGFRFRMSSEALGF